jgi:hypothetical protein
MGHKKENILLSGTRLARAGWFANHDAGGSRCGRGRLLPEKSLKAVHHPLLP